ncbi:MAG: response regulator transcription factor [Terriglobales bacterium]
MTKLLLVEDDLTLASEVASWLKEHDGYDVEVANNGEDALQLIQHFGFDLIVLDWELPGLSGLDVCRASRRDGCETAILFLTGKSAIDDKEIGFSAGADDYLSKPFQIRELSARCKALLRRGRPTQPLSDRSGAIKLDATTSTLHLGDECILLTKTECAVLAYLMRHPGRHFSAADLLKAVWPSQKAPSEDAVRMLIRSLRKKLHAGADDNATPLIDTVPGLGYVFNRHTD